MLALKPTLVQMFGTLQWHPEGKLLPTALGIMTAGSDGREGYKVYRAYPISTALGLITAAFEHLTAEKGIGYTLYTL